MSWQIIISSKQSNFSSRIRTLSFPILKLASTSLHFSISNYILEGPK